MVSETLESHAQPPPPGTSHRERAAHVPAGNPALALTTVLASPDHRQATSTVLTTCFITTHNLALTRATADQPKSKAERRTKR